MAENEMAEPKSGHTMLIILGAVAILWFMGSITFKGIRQ